MKCPEHSVQNRAVQSAILSILLAGIAMVSLDNYVVDVLMRDLVGHDRRPASFLIYLWLAAEQARREGAVQVSYQELAESVGVSKSSAQAAVSWLIRRKLLMASREKMRPLSPLIRCEARGETLHAV
jgi:hypothetical protein